MKMRMVLAGLLVAASMGISQDAGRRTGTTNPCPGGKGTAELDVVDVPSLDYLVRASSLIVEGTVVKVLPSFARDPNHVNAIETDSLIAVSKTLHGTPPTSNTVALFQIGGGAGSCAEFVPDDPLVGEGDQYILFLTPDNRKGVSNTSGAPRYVAVGVWSGKVKIANGSASFLPRVNSALHAYDGKSLSAFETALNEAINIRFPKK